MDNPYVSRGPVRAPDMFWGRAHPLHEIAAFLHGNQSVSIVGPRKIGKTSLLFHLLRPSTWPALGLGDDMLFTYLDGEVLGDCSAEAIFGQLAAEMALALEERGLPPEPALQTAAAKPSRLAFEAAVRKLNQRGLRVVLILDEFERLSANAQLNLNFFNALRSAAGRYQLVFVTASAQPLIQLTYSGRSQEILSSPFFNIFAPLWLGLLPEAEARQLIREPALRAGAGFSPALEDFVYALAGGHPLALQVACFHAFKTPDDQAETERQTLSELSAHFQYYWHNLSAAEQSTLQQLADVAARAPTDTTLRGLLRDLVQKGLLVQDQGRYRYASRAWASFVAAQALAPATVAYRGRLLPGAQLGHYEVQEMLGRGGMAEVYKGRHPRLDRIVAIKVLPPALATEANFRDRFEREARAVAALKHPNIVQVFDFGDIDGMYYMVMEYVAGQDLARYMREQGRLALAASRALLADLAGALDYAHAQGLVHRDVKPSNVMLEPTPTPAAFRAVLTDFGIAKIVRGQIQPTGTGLLGTLDYMAPEQIRASGDIDGRVDIYALGVMLYQMLTGQLPFSGENPGEVMLNHLQQPPPDPRRLLPDLPEPVARAIQKALAKKPEERFGTAQEFLAALGG